MRRGISLYNEPSKSFSELEEKDKSMTIHHRNIQKLAIEMHKIKNNLSPIPFAEIFKSKTNTHNLRKNRLWEGFNARTVFYGIATIRFRGPKTWDIVPNNI